MKTKTTQKITQRLIKSNPASSTSALLLSVSRFPALSLFRIRNKVLGIFALFFLSTVIACQGYLPVVSIDYPAYTVTEGINMDDCKEELCVPLSLGSPLAVAVPVSYEVRFNLNELDRMAAQNCSYSVAAPRDIESPLTGQIIFSPNEISKTLTLGIVDHPSMHDSPIRCFILKFTVPNGLARIEVTGGQSDSNQVPVVIHDDLSNLTASSDPSYYVDNAGNIQDVDFIVQLSEEQDYFLTGTSVTMHIITNDSNRLKLSELTTAASNNLINISVSEDPIGGTEANPSYDFTVNFLTAGTATVTVTHPTGGEGGTPVSRVFQFNILNSRSLTLIGRPSSNSADGPVSCVNSGTSCSAENSYTIDLPYNNGSNNPNSFELQLGTTAGDGNFNVTPESNSNAIATLAAIENTPGRYRFTSSPMVDADSEAFYTVEIGATNEHIRAFARLRVRIIKAPARLSFYRTIEDRNSRRDPQTNATLTFGQDTPSVLYLASDSAGNILYSTNGNTVRVNNPLLNSTDTEGKRLSMTPVRASQGDPLMPQSIELLVIGDNNYEMVMTSFLVTVNKANGAPVALQGDSGSCSNASSNANPIRITASGAGGAFSCDLASGIGGSLVLRDSGGNAHLSLTQDGITASFGTGALANRLSIARSDGVAAGNTASFTVIRGANDNYNAVTDSPVVIHVEIIPAAGDPIVLSSCGADNILTESGNTRRLMLTYSPGQATDTCTFASGAGGDLGITPNSNNPPGITASFGTGASTNTLTITRMAAMADAGNTASFTVTRDSNDSYGVVDGDHALILTVEVVKAAGALIELNRCDGGELNVSGSARTLELVYSPDADSPGNPASTCTFAPGDGGLLMIRDSGGNAQLSFMQDGITASFGTGASANTLIITRMAAMADAGNTASFTITRVANTNYTARGIDTNNMANDEAFTLGVDIVKAAGNSVYLAVSQPDCSGASGSETPVGIMATESSPSFSCNFAPGAGGALMLSGSGGSMSSSLMQSNIEASFAGNQLRFGATVGATVGNTASFTVIRGSNDNYNAVTDSPVIIHVEVIPTPGSDIVLPSNEEHPCGMNSMLENVGNTRTLSLTYSPDADTEATNTECTFSLGTGGALRLVNGTSAGATLVTENDITASFTNANTLAISRGVSLNVGVNVASFTVFRMAHGNYAARGIDTNNMANSEAFILNVNIVKAAGGLIMLNLIESPNCILSGNELSLSYNAAEDTRTTCTFTNGDGGALQIAAGLSNPSGITAMFGTGDSVNTLTITRSQATGVSTGADPDASFTITRAANDNYNAVDGNNGTSAFALDVNITPAAATPIELDASVGNNCTLISGNQLSLAMSATCTFSGGAMGEGALELRGASSGGGITDNGIIARFTSENILTISRGSAGADTSGSFTIIRANATNYEAPSAFALNVTTVLLPGSAIMLRGASPCTQGSITGAGNMRTLELAYSPDAGTAGSTCTFDETGVMSGEGALRLADGSIGGAMSFTVGGIMASFGTGALANTLSISDYSSVSAGTSASFKIARLASGNGNYAARGINTDGTPNSDAFTLAVRIVPATQDPITLTVSSEESTAIGSCESTGTSMYDCHISANALSGSQLEIEITGGIDCNGDSAGNGATYSFAGSNVSYDSNGNLLRLPRGNRATLTDGNTRTITLTRMCTNYSPLDTTIHLSASVDADRDGLIEIYTIEQLDNMRHNLAGTSYDDEAEDTAPGDTGSTLDSLPRGVCSNGTSMTQATCTSPATWSRFGCSTGTALTQATCSNWVTAMCSDGASADQSACETASGTWYSFDNSALETVLATCGYSNDSPHFLCGYELARSLDFSLDTSYDNNSVNTSFRPNNDSDISLATNTGWIPIGSYITRNNNTPFTGIFDGNDHTISKLYVNSVNRANTNYVGLFGYSTGVFRSIGLEQVYVSGRDNTGSLVGYAFSGSITSSYATGSVSGRDNTGGLVGRTFGSITSSYATGSVSGGGYIGGLAGISTGAITSSYATGSVSGGNNIGGLVGSVGVNGNNATGGSITTSYATGSVSGGNHTGGLVGHLYGGSITTSYATGSVLSSGSRVGGLVGLAQNNNTIRGTINSSYATGSVYSVHTTASFSFGGLVGDNRGDIRHSYASGSVSGTGNLTGGLAGRNQNGTITSSCGAVHDETGSSTVALNLLRRATATTMVPDDSNYVCAAGNPDTTTGNVAVFTAWNATWNFGDADHLPVLNAMPSTSNPSLVSGRQYIQQAASFLSVNYSHSAPNSATGGITLSHASPSDLPNVLNTTNGLVWTELSDTTTGYTLPGNTSEVPVARPGANGGPPATLVLQAIVRKTIGMTPYTMTRSFSITVPRIVLMGSNIVISNNAGTVITDSNTGDLPRLTYGKQWGEGDDTCGSSGSDAHRIAITGSGEPVQVCDSSGNHCISASSGVTTSGDFNGVMNQKACVYNEVVSGITTTYVKLHPGNASVNSPMSIIMKRAMTMTHDEATRSLAFTVQQATPIINGGDITASYSNTSDSFTHTSTHDYTAEGGPNDSFTCSIAGAIDGVTLDLLNDSGPTCRLRVQASGNQSRSGDIVLTANFNNSNYAIARKTVNVAINYTRLTQSTITGDSSIAISPTSTTGTSSSICKNYGGIGNNLSLSSASASYSIAGNTHTVSATLSSSGQLCVRNTYASSTSSASTDSSTATFRLSRADGGSYQGTSRNITVTVRHPSPSTNEGNSSNNGGGGGGTPPPPPPPTNPTDPAEPGGNGNGV